MISFATNHYLTSMPFTKSSKLTPVEDMADAYLVEKNWFDAKAYTLVNTSEIPKSSNIMTSHVIYRYMTDGKLKARIVPHGPLDQDKSFLRTDAPTVCRSPKVAFVSCS